MLMLQLYKQTFDQRILPDTQKGHYPKMRRPAQQGIKILNAYASNNRAVKYVKQKLTEKKRKNCTILVGNFNISSQ